jgi:hypothetical protein
LAVDETKRSLTFAILKVSEGWKAVSRLSRLNGAVRHKQPFAGSSFLLEAKVEE